MFHKKVSIQSSSNSPTSGSGLKMDNLVENIDSISVEVVSEIEKELEPNDIKSIVFLLYDVPDTALQRLIVYQKVSSDVGDTNMNLLYDWAQHMQRRLSWRYEFLEALAVCQLNAVIKKLGFNVSSVKNHYLPKNMHVCLHLNPMKKALYLLCEKITSESLETLRNTLKTYDIDTTEYESFELILLDMMCKKFIMVEMNNAEKYQIDKLAKILESFPHLQQFAKELMEIQNRLNHDPTPSSSADKCETKDDTIDDSEEFDYIDLVKEIDKLTLEIPTMQNLKKDRKDLEDAYPIRNPKRIGVCYIINQAKFHPSKESIESDGISTPLENRLGSTKDQIELEKTMTSLKFEVISHSNIGHKMMFECIKSIIKYRVQHDDSMFMLCLMSHGVRGHVYAADSVKVNIDDIQNLLDESFEQRKLEIPKIMIIQACQQNDDEKEPQTPVKFIADGPSHFKLRKLNFIIYWATAPELEAFRHEKGGTIFIQVLCYLIRKKANRDHLYDIFTHVNNTVAYLCTKLERNQVPIFASTLRKKLFLQIPKLLTQEVASTSQASII